MEGDEHGEQHMPGNPLEGQEVQLGEGEETRHDTSSDYESDLVQSMFGSLTSSVTSHVWEYGRRYHRIGDSRYLLPNDEEECEREALTHIMVKELMEGKLYYAPIDPNPHKIIDLGTGFGEWATEIAEAFPSAKVIGVDLSPVQPSWVPPNVEFVVDDIEGEWKYGDDVDFIHLRFVANVLRDHSMLISTCFKHLKPGGWLEIQDLYPRIGIVGGDENAADAHPANKCLDLAAEILRQTYDYADVYCLDRLAPKFGEQGFVHVERRTYDVPVGDWPRDSHLKMIGAEYRVILIGMLRAFMARPLAETGMEKTELEEIVNASEAAMMDRRIHAYCPIQAIWAQKPL